MIQSPRPLARNHCQRPSWPARSHVRVRYGKGGFGRARGAGGGGRRRCFFHTDHCGKIMSQRVFTAASVARAWGISSHEDTRVHRACSTASPESCYVTIYGAKRPSCLMHGSPAHHFPRYNISVNSGVGIDTVAVGESGRVSHGDVYCLIPVNAAARGCDSRAGQGIGNHLWLLALCWVTISRRLLALSIEYSGLIRGNADIPTAADYLIALRGKSEHVDSHSAF